VSAKKSIQSGYGLWESWGIIDRIGILPCYDTENMRQLDRRSALAQGLSEYELMMNLLMMWEIPSSHCCIMRCENKRTGKISEFAYQKLHAAKSRLVTLAQDKDNEILVADDESIALFKKSSSPSFKLIELTIHFP
jgi:hypothetical protein